MAKKLFIGGLSYNTTDATLKDTFSQAGTVETATIIIDRMSNRSKGFGFVEMTTEDEIKTAIEMFNGKEFAQSNRFRPVFPMSRRPDEKRCGRDRSCAFWRG